MEFVLFNRTSWIMKCYEKSQIKVGISYITQVSSLGVNTKEVKFMEEENLGRGKRVRNAIQNFNYNVLTERFGKESSKSKEPKKKKKVIKKVTKKVIKRVTKKTSKKKIAKSTPKQTNRITLSKKNTKKTVVSKAAKSKQVTPTKNKRTNKASPSTVTDVIERVDDSSIDNLSILQLKAELKAIGLSPVGSKIDLVERLKEGVLEYNPDPDGEKHYDYDPTNPLKKKYFLEIAPSSRSHCVRCYNIINQGTLRLFYKVLLKLFFLLLKVYKTDP